MKTVIYCFSATGNSLTTARIIAEGLGECTIVPVASLKNEAKIIKTQTRQGSCTRYTTETCPGP